MKTAFILLACLTVASNTQLLNPISNMAMGSTFGNPMWHSGMRYPGMMQTSQLNSVTYPAWRTHPLFRMSSSEKSYETNTPSDVINVPKVPSTHEVLTHMALANQNPKPYLDAIADMFYEPPKARTVLTPVASVVPTAPMTSKSYVDAVTDYLNDYQKARTVLAPMGNVVSMAPTTAKSYADAVTDYLNDYQKVRAVVTPLASTGSVPPALPVGPASTVYMQGMNPMRASVNMDDCVQDGTRWERGMDWLY